MNVNACIEALISKKCILYQMHDFASGMAKAMRFVKRNNFRRASIKCGTFAARKV